jgi:predicted molibdopterin-dependent oxidoreductase YjgC
VAATFIKNAAKAGVKLIVADPRRGDLARHATYNLQFNADTDVALLNAMLNVIVEEGLVDQAFIADRTSGTRAGRERQEVLAREDGADLRHRRQDDPRGGAGLYATSKGSMILWGMGHLAARARHRQRALPDRAGALHRPDRQARLRPAPAARPEQRAGCVRLGPHPDVLPGLSARERTRKRVSASRRCGRPSSIPIPGSRSWRS